jgi:hypothetical protein
LITGPLSNIVDFIEPLQWIPTTTRSRGRRVHDGIVDVYGAMIMRVKARMDAGEDVPDCLVKTLLLTQEQEKLDWEDLCMLSAVFTLGGVHSVRYNHMYLFRGTRITRELPLVDFGRHLVVPGSHLVTPRGSGPGPCRT